MVDREEFESLVLGGVTIPQLQKLYEVTRGTIAQYKRDFGLVGTSPNSKKRDTSLDTKQCNVCNNILPLTSFYSNGYTPKGTKKYKASCIYCENTSRKIDFTTKILEYLASKNKDYTCERCAYTGIWGSLDFHHINPEEKEFNIGDHNNKTVSQEVFDKTILPELEKCILLCPNCHRQEHLVMCRK